MKISLNSVPQIYAAPSTKGKVKGKMKVWRKKNIKKPVEALIERFHRFFVS